MGNMFDTLRNAFRIKDLRQKLFFTLFALLIYRLGTQVPVPGIDAIAFSNLVNRFGQLGSFMDIISGGAFKQVSIFALGIQPYINASIIIQLLTVAIPYLKNLSEEGEEGRKKLQQITRYVTVGLALLMSFFYWYGTRSAASTALPNWINAIMVMLSFTAGSAFVMWLGEQINDRGIGNGISILIGIGIISRLPSMIVQLYYTFLNWTASRNVVLAVLGVVFVIAVFLFIIALVVFISSSERRIPVQYAKKVVGRKVYGGQSSYLPIKVNQSGVLPVIFAVSVMVMPATIASFTGGQGPVAQFFLNFDRNPLYYLIYAVLIFAFTFFYSSISFNPVEIANNIQKNGGFIPGIRPGKPTADFIRETANRLSWFEALFLVFIVILPSVLSFFTKTSSALWFGGTAVLIVVGVALDMINQLEAQMMMRHYKGFLD
ncbi:MAG: preprotein translocase subunit SecY [Clostridiales bacterium]|nr:preprotein translocase subunit SecY [Clostridiales bacterium]MDD7432812.1 preprotein translocase subunit SecY [Clostridiales bacterium]MDY3061480.1 preprotein translocase subunit SecY [Eubacteriales bacterium]